MSGLIECEEDSPDSRRTNLHVLKPCSVMHSNVPLLQFNDIYVNLFLQLPGDLLGVKIGLKLL